jgi:hypothetical protein
LRNFDLMPQIAAFRPQIGRTLPHFGRRMPHFGRTLAAGCGMHRRF